MKGDTHLTKPGEYEKVHGEGRAWANGPILMKALPTARGLSRYGISASRRVGNAVVRNLVRRRLREILRRKALLPGYDVVFVARPSAALADYRSLDSAVNRVLVRAKILKVQSHENLAGGPSEDGRGV
jgi:ribonuclease P protein component